MFQLYLTFAWIRFFNMVAEFFIVMSAASECYGHKDRFRRAIRHILSDLTHQGTHFTTIFNFTVYTLQWINSLNDVPKKDGTSSSNEKEDNFDSSKDIASIKRTHESN